ncbi:ribonuclease III [Syntrophomonas erecta]
MRSSELKAAEHFLSNNGLEFNKIELMAMALTHPSYAQERNTPGNNQRLEFLGDAVLNFVVAEYLYESYPDKAEGELTKIRARVVCEQALRGVAQELRLGRYILLGKGEEMSGGRTRKSILADAVEAVIGAIYFDQGYECTRDFILKYLEPVIKETAQGDYYDFKSRLQELVQGKNRENVNYAILEESGPAHSRTFVAGVFYQKELLATGIGRSKKEAEQNAAEKALKDSRILSRLHMDSEGT